jgi:hypothetical protein
MFQEVPAADAYLLKQTLHDWNEAACVRILANLRRTVNGGGRLFVIERIIPGREEPHFAKLCDIHMMCWGTGRERTMAEYVHLLAATGWKYVATRRLAGAQVAVVVARVA